MWRVLNDDIAAIKTLKYRYLRALDTKDWESVLEKCFPAQYGGWSSKLSTMIPSFGQKLSGNRDLYRQVWDWTNASLQLTEDNVAPATSETLAPASAG